MFRKLNLVAVAAVFASGASAVVTCPTDPVTSCSDDATAIDECCVTRPGGLMVFRQRFEPDEGDEGRWGIDGLEIMK
jgi:ribonuclease T2